MNKFEFSSFLDGEQGPKKSRSWEEWAASCPDAYALFFEQASRIGFPLALRLVAKLCPAFKTFASRAELVAAIPPQARTSAPKAKPKVKSLGWNFNLQQAFETDNSELFCNILISRRNRFENPNALLLACEECFSKIPTEKLELIFTLDDLRKVYPKITGMLEGRFGMKVVRAALNQSILSDNFDDNKINNLQSKEDNFGGQANVRQ